MMKENRKYFLLVASLMVLFTGLSQEEKTSFSLEEVKNYALENNLSITNSKNQVEIANQQLKETRGIGLPQVNINGNFNHFINMPVQVMDASFFNPNAQAGEVIAFRAGTEFSSTGKMEVSQMIFNGSYIVALQVAKFYTSFQETSSNVSKEDVLFKTIQAYQLASVAKLNMSFADSIVTFTEELVTKQQHYFDLGMMLQEDLDQLNYSLLSAKNASVSAEIGYQNALNMLKLSMGYPIDQPIEITETPDNLLNGASLSSGDIHNNLTYILSKKKTKLSEYNLKNDRFSYLPSLSAFFQQSYSAYRSEFNFFDNEKWYPQTLWGLQLNIPVFSGGQKHYKVQRSKIELLIDQNLRHVDKGSVWVT